MGAIITEKSNGEKKENTFHTTACGTEEEFRKKLEELTSEDLAVFDELGSVPIRNFHSDTFILLICLEGKGTCKLEGRTFEVNKHDLVIGHPNMFVENAMVSLDFKCKGIVVSPAFFESIFFLGGNTWEAMLALRKQPILHLSKDEISHSLFNHSVIAHKLSETQLPHHKESLKLLLHSMIYELYDTLSPKLNLDDKGYDYSASEQLFRRFSKLLAEESPRRQEVGYYADRLCVTRKYLSSVCKQESGKTASALINGITINYIKQTLLSTDKTIKEIAFETGFNNLSFFGKYVRRELGLSPREYRQRKE